MKILISSAILVVAAGAYADQCCATSKPSAEKEFMRIAKEMEMQAEGKMACCKSTVEKPMAKGEKGCCNAPGEPKLFKVFVVNKGYSFFGCKDSAAKGRADLIAQGHKVGQVQKTIKAS